jgi:hypothetical protein
LPADHGPEAVAHGDEYDGGSHDGGQPPPGIRHKLADQWDSKESSHGAGRETCDAAQGHQEAVPQAVDEVRQQGQDQRQVQNGQAKH